MSKSIQQIKPILWKYNQLKDGSHPIKIEYSVKIGGKVKRVRKNTNVHATKDCWSGLYPNWVKTKDPLHQVKNKLILDAINEVNKPSEAFEEKDFWSFFKEFIQTRDMVGRIRIMEYERTREKLLLFEKAYKYPIDFESLNERFIILFKEHLSRQGYSPGYIIKYVKVIKQILKKALIKNLHTNHSFEDEAWRVKQIPFDSIYLNEDEIEQIRLSDLPPQLNSIRDTFVMGCHLGLRYSDLKSLTNNNVIEHKGVKMIRRYQGKTSGQVVIPMKKVVLEIWDTYGGVPARHSNGYFNRQIKDVVRNAGIAKFAMVTSHTMRRSFATNCYLAGIPSIDIMKITGHKSESSFLKYIKISREETAVRLGEHEFFK
jgi:integrase